MNIPAIWRNIAAVVLIVLGCLVSTVAVTVVWINQVVLDTDRYVATVAPLSEDPAIKDAVAVKVTDELFKRVQADDLTRRILPDEVDFLSGPIVGATQGYVQEQVRKELDSDWFSNLWEEANRRGHEFVIQALLGEGGTVYAENGVIGLDLSSLFETVKATLADHGINIFENVTIAGADTQLTLFEFENVTSVQSALNALNSLATWLPVLALLLLVGAVIASRNRWSAVFWIGLGLAVGMVLLLVGLSLLRSRYLDSLSSAGVDIPAATSFFDIIMSSFKTTVRRIFAAGLAVAAAGFIMGPYPAAVRLRANVKSFYLTNKAASARIDLGPAESWVNRQKTLLRAAGIVLALLILVALNQPSLATALLVAALLGLYLGVIEFLVRRAA